MKLDLCVTCLGTTTPYPADLLRQLVSVLERRDDLSLNLMLTLLDGPYVVDTPAGPVSLDFASRVGR